MADSAIGRGTLAPSQRESLPGARSDREVARELEARVARLEDDLRRTLARGPGPSALGARSVLSVLGMVVAVGVVLFLGYLAWKAIALVLIAVLFALALNPAVEFFVARGLARMSAAAVVFVSTLCVVAVLGLLLIPPLVTQVSRLPDLVSTLAQGHGPLGALERRFHIVEQLRGTLSGAGHGGVGGVASSGLDVVLGVLGTVASVVIVAFLTFFMLLEGPMWTQRLLALLPAAHGERCERIGLGIYRTVGGFVSGNLVASLLAGVTTAAVLLATGVPYAVPLALLVAFLDLLPIFGMIVALLVLAAVGFSQGVVTGIVVVGFVFVYHQFEVYLLRPLIYGRTIELSPLAVLVAVVVGTEMAGVVGALAAIPIAGALNVVFCELSLARAAARRDEILDLTGRGPA